MSNNKLFAIVQFDELINNKKAVELVPVSWLTENETMCYWPPKNKEYEVPQLTENECSPGSTWKTHPVEILTKANDYEQGVRRLKRSYRKQDGISSESESQAAEKDLPVTMDPVNVARALAQQGPLTSRKTKKRSTRSQSLEKIHEKEAFDDEEESTGDEQNNLETASGQKRLESGGIDNLNDLAKQLETCIAEECQKIKRSILFTLANRCDKIMQAVEYRAELPQKTQAWKQIGANLPFDDLEGFLKFEEDLKVNEEKQNTLKEIFQMAAAGHKNYEEDITAIMVKMLKKNVQLEFSGCGKKANGIGKIAFNKTVTYNLMEEFIKTKYHDSKDKLKIISVVSRFLSGASDRDGGRLQRVKRV